MVRPRRNWTAEEDAVLRSMVNNGRFAGLPLCSSIVFAIQVDYVQL